MQNKNDLYIRYVNYATLGLGGLIFTQSGGYCNLINDHKKFDKPNIIIIIADDMGWNDASYHGSEIKTPVLESLARSGIEFDQFYVHSVCSPTRASLLTGRPPSRYNILSPLGDPAGLPAGTVTIAGLLQKNGYETAISGKWHLGSVPEGRPMNYGFTSSYGYFLGQIDPYTHLYKTGVQTWHRNDELVEEEGHATDLITKEAIRVIKKDRNVPFFLYVAYSVPHYPLDEPDQWMNIYNNTISNKSRRLYAASMSHMDHSIGQILNALKEKGIEKNTVIMFLSDNGGQKNWKPVNEYNLKFEANDVLGDNRPLRDWKGSLYNGALRVPAILSWPGKLKHTKITEALNVADIYPTMAYIAKIKVPEELNIEGINFWPVLNGKKIGKERTMYWKSPNAMAVKKGDWKLIHHGKRFNEGEDELFNLRMDPFEKNSLAGSDQTRIIELRKELKYQLLQDSICAVKNIK